MKTKSGTGAGNFANSSLYFMSRAASALFGAGDLDEVALYNKALSAATIEDHYAGTAGGGEPPVASFTAAPNPGPDRRRRSTSTARTPATPTARSSNTNGTSTATAATRPKPGPNRSPYAATPRPAATTCACG